jgi:hypothetical protein
VEKGRLGSAARRLAGTAAVAAVDNEVVTALRDKNRAGAAGPLVRPKSQARVTSHTRRRWWPLQDLRIRHLTGAVWVDAPPHGHSTTSAGVPQGAAHTYRPHHGWNDPRPDEAVCQQAHLAARVKWGPPSIAVSDMIYRLVTKAIIRQSNRRDFALAERGS